MSAPKQMFIKGIFTPKLSLDVFEVLPLEEGKPINYSLSHRFTEIDDKTGQTDLRFQITKESNVGFTAEVIVSAVFEVENYKENSEGLYLMKNTAITILYPYLRNAVSQLCSLAGVTKVTLPVIDTIQTFGDQTAQSGNS